MKKGSKAKHCFKCGKIVFWAIPDGEPILGLVQMMKMKEVVPYKYITNRGYCCEDCLRKEEEEKRKE